MPSTFIKISAGISGATAVGGGATAIYLVNNNTKAVKQTNTDLQNASLSTVTPEEKKPKKITELLKEKGLSILDTGNTSGWKTNWDKFKAEYESTEPQGEWAFTDWTTVKAKTDDTSNLRSKCTENSGKDALDENSSLFQTVKKYCTNSPN
ncbi:hypothetical protein A6V39_03515 [Candidatus Mycoplasma haematobovis]|uniref:Uncharacterized protein n=1 Tax=Candidatus Mycoplasma haematobovis TaxID=432608 RepID=A0A1A9QCY4_9MOLU|nr:hypothetical protein [Candidatus Mycoplasma haematobovis]OAL09954.1 hypothetical protein A6V39_03515 [Candidatus Mycoplasma haematobovis]